MEVEQTIVQVEVIQTIAQPHYMQYGKKMLVTVKITMISIQRNIFILQETT